MRPLLAWRGMDAFVPVSDSAYRPLMQAPLGGP